MTFEILFLLLAFQAKHLITDYYLQFPYMYENKGKPIEWIKPLFDHSAIHAFGTILILAIYTSSQGLQWIVLFLGLFDLITHFTIDRWKATRKTNPSESKFWQYLGIDQMLHHIVGILIIFFITTQG